jgi:hypothetical protein
MDLLLAHSAAAALLLQCQQTMQVFVIQATAGAAYL